VASNKPAAAAPGRHDEIGEANADFGDQAPDQITGLAQALAFYRAVLALVARFIWRVAGGEWETSTT